MSQGAHLLTVRQAVQLVIVDRSACRAAQKASPVVAFWNSAPRHKLAVLADPAVSEYAVLNADLMLTLPALPATLTQAMSTSTATASATSAM